MTNTMYKFYANCILVQGACRSTICDLQRNKFHYIPNGLISLLEGDIIDAVTILKKLDEEDKSIFDEYIEYLLDRELIFECEAELLEQFPTLSMEWDFPSHVSNAIFDGENELPFFNQSLMEQLEILCCNYFQIRFFKKTPKAEIERILLLVMPSQIKAIDVIIAADNEDNNFEKWLIDVVNKNRKIRCLTIHSAEKNEKLQAENFGFGTILKVKEKIKNEAHCGNIHHSYFSTNIETFTESQHHNTCLNRKIAIDADGNIKNCPSMAKSYGNIKDTKLIEVVSNPDFQKVWHIKKDEISKCKDCEFRHICTDCRAYIENPEDQYSAPLKCGYNPYTCEWEEWSTNPLKQKAIEYYGMQELVKK
jgi:SPASM domain peptide maturase of grasp-with-spasm system